MQSRVRQAGEGIMNWDAISAVGEIVGALAVVVSLIYLAAQIRQNTKVARASMRHGITDSAMVGGRLLAENDQLAALLHSHINGADLEPHQYLRLQALAYMTPRNWENIHYQYLSGMLTNDEWRAFRENLKAMYQANLWQDYWNREQGIYTDAFRNEIRSILTEIETGEKVAKMSVLLAKETDKQDCNNT